MLPYNIGLNSGSSDLGRVREEKREERLNAQADKEHERLQEEAAAAASSSSSSSSSSSAQSSSSSLSSASDTESVVAPDTIASPEPLADGPTPKPLLSSLHASQKPHS